MLLGQRLLLSVRLLLTEGVGLWTLWNIGLIVLVYIIIININIIIVIVIVCTLIL